MLQEDQPYHQELVAYLERLGVEVGPEALEGLLLGDVVDQPFHQVVLAAYLERLGDEVDQPFHQVVLAAYLERLGVEVDQPFHQVVLAALEVHQEV
jgi:hypothetical protein